jgi:hypothetical protein
MPTARHRVDQRVLAEGRVKPDRLPDTEFLAYFQEVTEALGALELNRD